MTAERLIFGNSVQGMLGALGEITPEVKAQLIELGVNPDKLLPAFSVPVYSQLLDFIGAQRFPRLEGNERDRALGQEFIRGFGRTFVGKATMALGSVLGPMRTVNNYSNAEAVPVSAKSVQVWCHPVLRPWYYVGVFEQAGWELHGPSYKVELQRVEQERADFLISW